MIEDWLQLLQKDWVGALFLWPFNVFIVFPWLAFGVAAVFFGLWFQRYTKQKTGLHGLAHHGLWLPVVAWALYGIYETSIANKGYNIRVDMLVIVPALYVASIGGLVLWFLSARGHR